MTYALALAIVAIAYLAVQIHLRDRRIVALTDGASARQADHAAQVERLWVRAERERQLLLNRIQAPDVGVAQALDEADEEKPPPRGYVKFDDDEDFHAAMRELEPDGHAE